MQCQRPLGHQYDGTELHLTGDDEFAYEWRWATVDEIRRFFGG